MILALLSFPPPARGTDMPERKTVVLLYPDPRLWPELIAVEQGIRSTLEPALASGIDFMWGLLLQRAGRRRVELSLDGRLRFESLLSELAAGLIHVSLNSSRWIGPISTNTSWRGPSFVSHGPWRGRAAVTDHGA